MEIVKDYVSGMKNSAELLDMISAALEDENAKVAKGDLLYPEVRAFGYEGHNNSLTRIVLFHVQDDDRRQGRHSSPGEVQHQSLQLPRRFHTYTIV